LLAQLCQGLLYKSNGVATKLQTENSYPLKSSKSAKIFSDIRIRRGDEKVRQDVGKEKWLGSRDSS